MTSGEPLRRLVVVRHAKASRPAKVPDEQRPLSPRGRRDAPLVGRWMSAGNWLPDLALCSPALRARQTWQLVAGGLAAPPPVRFEADLYHPSLPVLLDVIGRLPAHVATAVLVGHNPSLHDLAQWLAGDDLRTALPRGESELPTSSATVLIWRGSWRDRDAGTARLDELYVGRAAGSHS